MGKAPLHIAIFPELAGFREKCPDSPNVFDNNYFWCMVRMWFGVTKPVSFLRRTFSITLMPSFRPGIL